MSNKGEGGGGGAGGRSTRKRNRSSNQRVRNLWSLSFFQSTRFTLVLTGQNRAVHCGPRTKTSRDTPHATNSTARSSFACKTSTSSPHLSLNREGRWGTTDDFTNSFLHFSLFSTGLWDLANSRRVRSLMLSSHLFFCLPCLLLPCTVPRKMVLA